MTPVELLVRAAIERRGPIPFDEVMALALYHPEHGFYASGGQAGRRGDFLTSPEVGPLFGAVVARALDGWWADAGEPDVFTVVEAGAGPGALARSVLGSAPRLPPGLALRARRGVGRQRAAPRRAPRAPPARVRVREPSRPGRGRRARWSAPGRSS